MDMSSDRGSTPRRSISNRGFVIESAVILFLQQILIKSKEFTCLVLHFILYIL